MWGGAWWQSQYQADEGKGRRGLFLDNKYEKPAMAATVATRGGGKGQEGGGGGEGGGQGDVCHGLLAVRDYTPV